MKKILNYIMVGMLISVAYNCEEDLPSGSTNYVTFEEGPRSFRVDKDATTTQDINVYTGNKTGSARTFTVLVDDASTLSADYTIPSTVTIPANSNVGSLPLSVTDDSNLGFTAETLVLDIQDEAGIIAGSNLTVNVTELCPDTLVQFNLTTDNWPDETTWEIYDLSDPVNPVVIFSGGPYINPDDDFTTFNFEFCLAPGNYGVAVYDSYGDGGSSFTLKAGSTDLAGGTLSGTILSQQFTIN